MSLDSYRNKKEKDLDLRWMDGYGARDIHHSHQNKTEQIINNLDLKTMKLDADLQEKLDNFDPNNYSSNDEFKSSHSREEYEQQKKKNEQLRDDLLASLEIIMNSSKQESLDEEEQISKHR